MKNRFLEFVKGEYFTDNKKGLRNWALVVYITFLGIIMIYMSHRTDQRVHKIADRSVELKEIKSRYISLRMQRMQLQLESKITNDMAEVGLKPSNIPPKKINKQAK